MQLLFTVICASMCTGWNKSPARAKKKKGELALEPEGFIVTGTEGPLKEGELERAANWIRPVIQA